MIALPGWLLQIVTRLIAAVAAGAFDWLVARGWLDAGAAADATAQVTATGVIVLLTLTTAVYGIVRPLLSRWLHPADDATPGPPK
jgi:hypothetical protein